MALTHIKDSFARILKRLGAAHDAKQIVRDAVCSIARVELDTKAIVIKEGVVRITTHPTLKAEILFHTNAILERINATGNKKITSIE